MKALACALLALTLTACSGLPKLSLTPVQAEVGIGNETEHSEDNMVKTEINTGQEKHTEITANTVEQVENYITEAPIWLVMAFAFALALAVPSPLAYLTHRRVRKERDKYLNYILEANNG